MDDHEALTEAELDEVVTWNVVRVARFLGQRLSERLAPQELHPVHFGVLAQLDITGQMSQADLARAVLLRPQSIAPLLDGLERRGLLQRTGARVRGRRNPVQITDEGRHALQMAWAVATSSNDLKDAGLTTAEGAELNRLLLKVVGAGRNKLSDESAWDWPAP
ncbi:MarR family winged helix-turn-helix transcriptional regulator [Kineococcus rubinsiae]|uniref:MarR family winged helix-turn-helix transcriptional regulator n=1 Tax=Kineococcus rubinsiae TaxID=2609562 RepID=UPI001431A8D7|nr:MarR family transcriptional regulator [Kineococcus rubinsiae]